MEPINIEAKHYPSLDGLRAYAALAVLAFHTEISFFWLGWIGVHVFFVLSGFLITGILLRTKGAANYFQVFYFRRFLRIFPIYYLLLAAVIIVALYLHRNIEAAWYYVFYIQNWYGSWHNWSAATFPKWLYHTWTLAIEEQFYIFFPLIVRFTSKKALVFICCFFIVLSIFMRYYLSIKFPGNNINWCNTFSNLDLFSVGALIAIKLPTINTSNIKILLWMALELSVIIFCVFTHDPLSWPIYLTSFHGQVFIIGVHIFATATVFTLATSNYRVLNFFFNNKYAIYIGKISYGIYLYHIPIFILTDHFWDRLGLPQSDENYWLALIKLSCTILVAALSFELFESRILKLKDKHKYAYSLPDLK